MDGTGIPTQSISKNIDDSVPIQFLLGTKYRGYATEAIRADVHLPKRFNSNKDYDSFLSKPCSQREAPAGSVGALLKTMGRSEREKVAAQILLGEDLRDVAKVMEQQTKDYYRYDRKGLGNTVTMFNEGNEVEELNRYNPAWLVTEASPANFTKETKEKAHQARRNQLAAAASDLSVHKPSRSMVQERQMRESQEHLKRETEQSKITALRRAVNTSAGDYKLMASYKAKMHLEAELHTLRMEQTRHVMEAKEKINESKMASKLAAKVREELKERLPSTAQRDPAATAQMMRTLALNYSTRQNTLEEKSSLFSVDDSLVAGSSLTQQGEPQTVDDTQKNKKKLASLSLVLNAPSIQTLEMDSVEQSHSSTSGSKLRPFSSTARSSARINEVMQQEKNSSHVFGGGFKQCHGDNARKYRDNSNNSKNFAISAVGVQLRKPTTLDSPKDPLPT